MRIQFKNDDEILSEYNSITYDSQSNVFGLRKDTDLIEYRPLLNLDDEYDPSNFRNIFLYNKDTGENSIYKVEVESGDDWKRIGWIFPIQALLSREHTQASNRYFLKYAYIATYLLLDSINKIIDDVEPDEIGLDLFYEPETNILVLDEDNCSAINNFNFEEYIIGLFQYGYASIEGAHGSVDLPISTEQSAGRIKIQRMSQDVRSKQLLNTIFLNHIARETNHLVKFYFCYQIIEIMIQEIFDKKFREMFRELDEDTDNLFDVRDELSEISGEKNRVRLLFNKYSQNIDQIKRMELNQVCCEMLEHMHRKQYTEVASNLYAVRCLLVHKLYALSSDNSLIQNWLDRINNVLLGILLNILITFHYE